MRKLLLVGGGHAHLHVLKRLIDTPIKDVEVTLVSSSTSQYYSGMFSGYAEGLYDDKQISVNLVEFAKEARVKWVQGSVVSVNAELKYVTTDNGETIPFDVVSFDIGSLTAMNHTPDHSQNIFDVKPNYRFIDVIKNVREEKNIVIVGGGAAGIEVGLSLTVWRKARGIETPITLISGDRLLKEKRKSVSAKIEKIVRKKGIRLIKNETVTKVEKSKLTTSANNEYDYDKLIWLTGPRASNLFKSSNLPTDDRGFLSVGDTLQVESFPYIFGAGDCVTLTNYPTIDKTGVYAVREGPILYENIKAYFEFGEGKKYTPQKDYLSILSIGHKQGFLIYKDRAYAGKWAWYLKNWIDTNFVKNYGC